ncbi:DUF3429 domain-containing protein [Roseomonas sp. GC11]|uniref:DUF3429 domain-containing protein n=1 Tax=Roseomonas sp. GC11 TaxID=2950546 RepID=UPI00210E8520|nr:DUF3429 domain-containing protein [Roseomonas sp. GC11]MCQ4162366.1 DUF3429 domain-containing protein [Roseomonas sp. GC11]
MSSLPAVPPAASWLGGAGLLPFLTLAVASLMPGESGALAATALLAYGAAILSFLGGIRWGLAMARAESGALWAELSLSVLPSLLAWVALLLPRPAGLLLLAVSLAGQWLLDSRTTLAPGWYPRLRLPLSLGAIAALLVGYWFS